MSSCPSVSATAKRSTPVAWGAVVEDDVHQGPGGQAGVGGVRPGGVGHADPEEAPSRPEHVVEPGESMLRPVQDLRLRQQRPDQRVRLAVGCDDRACPDVRGRPVAHLREEAPAATGGRGAAHESARSRAAPSVGRHDDAPKALGQLDHGLRRAGGAPARRCPAAASRESAGQNIGDLPAEVGRVRMPGVEALAGEGRHHVRGVAEQERAPVPPAVGDQGVEAVDHGALDLLRGDRPVRRRAALRSSRRADARPRACTPRLAAGTRSGTGRPRPGMITCGRCGSPWCMPYRWSWRIVERVGDEPRVRESCARSWGRPAEFRLEDAAAVAAEDVGRAHRIGRSVGGVPERTSTPSASWDSATSSACKRTLDARERAQVSRAARARGRAGRMGS